MGPGETFRTPFCAINPEGACRACTGRHPTGNGHRAAMPRDESDKPKGIRRAEAKRYITYILQTVHGILLVYAAECGI